MSEASRAPPEREVVFSTWTLIPEAARGWVSSLGRGVLDLRGKPVEEGDGKDSRQHQKAQHTDASHD